MNRSPLERWVGFVFATLKQYEHGALRIHWETPMGPLSHGLATLDRDLCAASVLEIDWATLTSAAEEASNRERASSSPFSLPSMEDQGFQFAEKPPPLPPPPADYTLGDLLHDLEQFGERYHDDAELIRQQHPAIQKHDRIQLGAFVSYARDSLQRIPGFNELRALTQALWSEEIGVATGKRIVDALVQGSNGSLSPSDAERLTLVQTASKLSAPPETVTAPKQTHEQGPELAESAPARLTGADAIRDAVARQRVVLHQLGNTQNPSGIDWQTGVNELWKLWR